MYRKTFFIFVFLGCITSHTPVKGEGEKMEPAKKNQEAIFAMGCFWCGAAAFSDHETNIKFPGIISIRVGYTGGDLQDPTYQNHEGHKEAVKIVFDPTRITYEQLLDIFWHNVDPLDGKGQFCDQGPSYTSVIFYTDDDQKKTAFASKEKVEKNLGKPVLTEILEASPFYDAEEYHQDYKIKNPIRYNFYRWNCGRDARLREIWGMPDAKKNQ